MRKNKNTGPITASAGVEVRNDDVNGALRRLKKILDNDSRHKELSKREFYEKPSIKKKRAKAQAVKRSKKELHKRIARGDYLPTEQVGTKYLKGKRSKRKVEDQAKLVDSLRKK